MIIGLAVAVVFLALVLTPYLRDEKQQPVTQKTLSPEQIRINQQFAVLRKDGANNLSKILKAGDAKISDLPQEINSLLSGISYVEVTEVKKANLGSDSSFEVKFTSRDSLATTHRDFGNALLKKNWTLISGGRAAQAARLEFAKGVSPRMTIEIEMTQLEGQGVTGVLLFL